MDRKDGMNYAPVGKPKPVVKEGEFVIAAIALDHGHIYGMCNGLVEAGATLKWVYDKDPKKVEDFCKAYKGVKAAKSEEEILSDPEVKLVCGAAVTSMRCALGLRVMAAGKDYFTDKAPLTSLEQLAQAKEMVEKTGRKYMCYYGERLHVESAVFAGQLIKQGAIGKPIHVDGFGPHRVGDIKGRPDWFFKKEYYGGILCDIGSHQIEQFLYYCDCKDATVQYSQVGNYNHPNQPELEDLGEATLLGDNGTTQHFRVDWFTPDGLSTWGDGRTFIIGTEGYIELRKYVNVATDKSGDHLFLVNKDGEQHFELEGKVGYPFFGELILDCINRTEIAMTQAHCFKAAELCVKAELQAERVYGLEK
ncbi:MAG: Gfo/Idh/MocA family oxidoreductase [Pseudobutyrivibrio sp.]|uniref:Gfo/Idh/MocA family protein n=1 Tax=Pseudobutyrivibrio sp. TaxID=2014367 RepID=UPI001B409813|nr:Gfo/Idh/MocA family oxidoreductase [Pseudobutyrivibrio sp.]MBP5324997.1 Gfo/Idh/MocA family oxidoreductase [Pseudobutyrivibrio sp.]MBR5649389.1 Gfo/Idh/MocA family oxidoreductase [Pseudobutyrivibrio sp.]